MFGAGEAHDGAKCGRVQEEGTPETLRPLNPLHISSQVSARCKGFPPIPSCLARSHDTPHQGMTSIEWHVHASQFICCEEQYSASNTRICR